VRRILLSACSVAAAAAAVASTVPAQSRADARPCGLPATSPLFIDYADATVPFWKPIFGKPGLAIATPGAGVVPTGLRAAGAATVYFDLKLGSRVGTPDAPADPATIVDVANKEFDFAVKSTGCQTPLIAENELFGATTPAPWSPGTTQYRADVLALLTQLAARGAHPYLLISSPPYVGDTAADWWRQVAQVSDIVREFFPSPVNVYKAGPIGGSRILRVQMRQAMGAFTAMGIPTSRLGLMLEFESGLYGRNGLQPSTAWFEFVKLDFLASRQIAHELGLPTVWSWGWATYNETSPSDVDKQAAACVYLWARSQSLCNGPAVAGSGFDTSLTEGQLAVPARVYCSLGTAGVIASATRAQLAAITGDAETASAVAFGWAAARSAAKISPAQIDAAEQSVIATAFHGNRSAYLAALARAHANRGLARSELASELREQVIEDALPAPPAAPTAVADFYDTNGATNARLVTARKPVSWLGGRTRGIAIAGVAPARVFAQPAGKAGLVADSGKTVAVTALGPTLPLAAFPLSLARPAIGAAVQQLARGDAYQAWLQDAETKLLSTTTCLADDVPQPLPVGLADFLPFLRVG
jgi:hypothetical protein